MMLLLSPSCSDLKSGGEVSLHSSHFEGAELDVDGQFATDVLNFVVGRGKGRGGDVVILPAAADNQHS